MGKSQKKRAMRRHNPVRVPDSHLPKGLASASKLSSKTQAILPVIQKMESPDAAERKWACVAISNLIQNDPATRRLLQGKNIIGALINRLTDSEEEVVVEAVGTLRNLCIDGGYDICAEMYNKNILAPLRTFIPKVSITLAQYLTSPKTSPGSTQKIVYEFADNVITTLWCLSETSNKALNAINEIQLIPFLMSFLASRDKLPLAPVSSAAHCLYVLTDENLPAIADVRSDAGYISCLLSIARPAESVDDNMQNLDLRSVNLSVLAAGILHNISPLPPLTTGSIIDIDREIILPLLRPVVSSISLSEVSNTVQALITRQSSEPQIQSLTLNHFPKSDHMSPIELELELLEQRLRTVQLGLEVLTGTCATLPDPEADAQESGTDDNIEDDEDAPNERSDVEMNAEDGAPSENSKNFMPTLVPPLLALIHPTALSFPPLASLSPHPPTTSVLGAIHISALECLNNIFLSLANSTSSALSAEKEAGSKVWYDIWSALSFVGSEVGLGQERRQEFWEVAAGILWGIGTIWKGKIEPEEGQVNLLIQLCEASEDPKTRVKCIGTLDCLAQYPELIKINQITANYLVSKLPIDESLPRLGIEPLIQIISSLIDIYSDEAMPYDINFRQMGVLEKLEASVEGAKKAVKAIDRRKEGGKEVRRRGDEMLENLVAFIHYRRDLGL